MQEFSLDATVSKVDPDEARQSQLESAKVQRTLALIKPDAMQAGKLQDIIQKIREAGFDIVQEKRVSLSREQAQLFYREHEARPFYSELTEWMSSAPIHAMILEKVNAVQDWRALMGPTDPAKARIVEPTSIRGLFGTDGMQNATHGSDCVTSAEREISIIFDDQDETTAPMETVKNIADPSVKDEGVAIDEPISENKEQTCAPAKDEQSVHVAKLDPVAIEKVSAEEAKEKIGADGETPQEEQHNTDAKGSENVVQDIIETAVTEQINEEEEHANTTTDVKSQVLGTEIKSKGDTDNDTQITDKASTTEITTNSHAEQPAKDGPSLSPKTEEINKSGAMADETQIANNEAGKSDDIKADEASKADTQSNKQVDKQTNKAPNTNSTESHKSGKSATGATKAKATVTKQASARTTTVKRSTAASSKPEAAKTTGTPVKRASAVPSAAKTDATKTTGTVRKTTKASSTTTTTASRRVSPPTSETVKKATMTTERTTLRTARPSTQKPVDSANKTSTVTTKRSTTGMSRLTASTAATAKRQGTEASSMTKKNTTTSSSTASKQSPPGKKPVATAGAKTATTIAKRVTRTTTAAATKKMTMENAATTRKSVSSTEKDPRLIAAKAAKSTALKDAVKAQDNVPEEPVTPPPPAPEPEKPTSTEIERVVQESSAKTEVHDKEVERVTVNQQQSKSPTSPPKIEQRPESDGKLSAASTASRPRTPEVAQLRSKFENLQNNDATSSAASSKRVPLPPTGGNRVKDMISRFNE